MSDGEWPCYDYGYNHDYRRNWVLDKWGDLFHDVALLNSRVAPSFLASGITEALKEDECH